jgi:hypothetical protein
MENEIVIRICGEPWDQKINKDIAGSIYDAVYKKRMVHYFIAKGWICSEVLAKTIHWEALEKAMGNLSHSRRIWVSKHAANDCGVNKCLVDRQQEGAQPFCPRCTTQVEDSRHIVECDDFESQATWKEQLEKFEKELTKIDTDEHVKQALLRGIRNHVKLNSNPRDNSDLPSKVLLCFIEQELLGWTNLFFGMSSKRWQPLQDEYYKKKKSRRSGLMWQQRMLRLVFDIHFAIWEYRNQRVHNCPVTEQCLRDQVADEIRAEYSLGHEDLVPAHLYLMNQTLDYCLSKSRPEQELWLKQVRAARRAGNKLKRQEANNLRRVQQQQDQP